MARILVVDDDQPVQRVLERLLRGLGHEVLAAPNGEEGLELIRNVAPDLVILDYRMPGLNGVEVLRAIPGTGRRPRVLMLTAHAEPGVEDEALRLGACGCMFKPFNLEDMEKGVEKALASPAPAEGGGPA